MRDAEQQVGHPRAEDLDLVEVDAFGMASVVLYGHEGGPSQIKASEEPRSYFEEGAGRRRPTRSRFRPF